MATLGSRAGERRGNPRLRYLFDHAYPILEPFFDPASGWDSHTRQHVAAGLLRDNFPELSGPEVHTLIRAAARVYGERHPHADLPLRGELRAARRDR